jgi:hypothetical protein
LALELGKEEGEKIQNTCSFDHSVSGALCQKCEAFFSAKNELLRS